MQPQYTDMMLTRFTCNMLPFFQAAKEAETRANAERELKALKDKLANIATIQQAVRRGKVVRNAGGGDCLPRAISQHKFGTENNHELVRIELCELIRASWEHLKGSAVDENGSEMTMNQAIESFGKHQWMGEFGLTTASMYLGARIQVWCDTGKYPPPRSYPEEATMMPDCHLLRTNENHYEYFIPHADEESDEDDSESGEEGSESEEEGSESEEEGSESEEEGSESEEEGSESEDERSDEDEQSDVSESERDDADESEEESEEDSESEEEEPDEASNPEDPEDDESETKSATSEYQR